MKTGRATACTLLLALIASSLFAETPKNGDVRALFEEAMNAYKQKNYALFVEKMKAVRELRPHHQVYIYDLAGGYALAGNKTQAIALLSQAAAMGFVFPGSEKDEDFASLRGVPDYEAALKKFATNAKPIGRSETAFTVHEKGLVPEGLAHDPNTQTFFVGSVYRRKIVAVNAAGEARDFSHESDGLWSVMGMKVDASRRLLWGCTAGHKQMANAKPEDDGKTAVFKYDLDSGKLIKKYPVPDDGQKHWLGDLALDSQGNVYASDSLSPAIYVIRPAQGKMELFLAGAPFINPQGIVPTPDEKKLLLADYLKGLFLIDLETKEVEEVAAPHDATLGGIDGIYRAGTDLIAVQNGIKPNRVIRLKLCSDWLVVEKQEVLEANNPVFDEPTLGVIVGDEFYFIANSQWGAIDDKGKLGPEEKLKDAVVLRMRL
jgi:sugar lactone lactonase YvrE